MMTTEAAKRNPQCEIVKVSREMQTEGWRNSDTLLRVVTFSMRIKLNTCWKAVQIDQQKCNQRTRRYLQTGKVDKRLVREARPKDFETGGYRDVKEERNE